VAQRATLAFAQSWNPSAPPRCSRDRPAPVAHTANALYSESREEVGRQALAQPEPILEWTGIEAAEALVNSSHTKVVVIGNPKNGLPLILSGQ
jgi:hypothetical protein